MQNTLNTSAIRSTPQEYNNALDAFRNLPAMEDILEVTYAYDMIRDVSGNPVQSSDGFLLAYNKIFEGLSGHSLQDVLTQKATFETVLTESEKTLKGRIAELESLKQELLASSLDDRTKALMESTIQSYITRVEIAKTGLVFELEKAGFDTKLSEDEKNQKIAHIETLQLQEFGADVSTSWVATEQVLYKMRANFAKHQHILSDAERAEFAELYQEMREFACQKFPGHTIPELTNFVEEKPKRDDLADLSDIHIPRENYIKIFQVAIDMMHLPQKVEINENLSSIFDGAKTLGIPASKAYETLSLARVLELISHEIRTHYVNQRNGERFANGARSAGDIEKEEGLAMMMEGLLRGYTLDEISRQKRGVSETRILACEAFRGNGQKYRDFVHILAKLNTGKDTGDTNEALLRRSCRNLPFGYTQKKDLSYGLGLEKTIDYLHRGGDIKKLFSGKFGLADIESGLVNFADNSEMLFPFFIEDSIIFYQKNKKINHEEFVQFLREKYANILTETDFEKIEKLAFSYKRKIIQILRLLDTNNPQ